MQRAGKNKLNTAVFMLFLKSSGSIPPGFTILKIKPDAIIIKNDKIVSCIFLYYNKREVFLKKLLAFYGSPRVGGNSSILLSKFLEGVKTTGKYEINEVVLREYNISPCLEIYKCKETGRCIINDDFQKIYDFIESADTIALASPVMFYAVSAHTKILMDRCQSFWAKKYILKIQSKEKDGYFFCVGATKGEKLFDGILMSVKYFFDTFNCKLRDSILVRGVDEKEEILKHPEYLQMAYELGKKID